jgi:hypothetical protein
LQTETLVATTLFLLFPLLSRRSLTLGLGVTSRFRDALVVTSLKMSARATWFDSGLWLKLGLVLVLVLVIVLTMQ